MIAVLSPQITTEKGWNPLLVRNISFDCLPSTYKRLSCLLMEMRPNLPEKYPKIVQKRMLFQIFLKYIRTFHTKGIYSQYQKYLVSHLFSNHTQCGSKFPLHTSRFYYLLHTKSYMCFIAIEIYILDLCYIIQFQQSFLHSIQFTIPSRSLILFI